MSQLRKIITLGDSFTFGHGCSDREYYYDHDTKTFIGDHRPFKENIPSQYCWPTLLQQHMHEVEVINLSQPANSNQGLFRNLLTYCETNTINEGDIIIFNGSFPGRIDIASGARPEVTVPWVMGWDHQSQMENEIEYNVAKKMYITHLFNDSIGYAQSLSSVLATHAFATMYKAKYIWSLPNHVYPKEVLDKLKPINHLRITDLCKYDFSGTNTYDFNKTCFAPDYHVNNLGHSIYLQKQIIPVIQSLL